MLVLSRKAQQKIQIGPHITVTILQVKGQTIRVGIEAPREIPIVRTELIRTTNDEMDAAVQKALDNGALDVLERVLEHRDMTDRDDPRMEWA